MARHFFVNGKLHECDATLEALFGTAVPCTPVKGEQSSLGEDGDTPIKEALPAVKKPSAEASLKELVVSRRFLVLSLPSCPQCEELAAFLAARGVVSSSVVVKWDKANPEYSDQKQALAVHAGPVFSFPQVFANGRYEGGYDEVIRKADAGAYDELFEQEFGVAPTTVQRWVEQRPMVAFSLPNCPQCDVLRSHLEGRGLPVDRVFIKLDKAAAQYATLKAQLIELMGKSQFSFPQTFVRAEYQGDFDEVIAKSEAGHLEEFFLEAFGVAPKVVASSVEEKVVPPAAISFDDDF